MVWVTSLPAAALIIGGVGAALLCAIGVRLALRVLIPASQRDSVYAISDPLMTAFAGLFALMMALTLASEANLVASAQGIVSNEAADAASLAWAATSPGVNPAPIQSALLGYLRATRAYEWQGNQAADGDDPETSHALAGLERVVRAEAGRPGVTTPTSSELLTSLDALTNDRRARLAAASHELPAFYVIVLVVAGVAVIINATVLTLRSGWRLAFPVGALAVVIGLSIALLFALGTPWRGSITVSGQPIDAVVHDLTTGYFSALGEKLK
jgi:hypothetical protein